MSHIPWKGPSIPKGWEPLLLNLKFQDFQHIQEQCPEGSSTAYKACRFIQEADLTVCSAFRDLETKQWSHTVWMIIAFLKESGYQGKPEGLFQFRHCFVTPRIVTSTNAPF